MDFQQTVQCLVFVQKFFFEKKLIFDITNSQKKILMSYPVNQVRTSNTRILNNSSEKISPNPFFRQKERKKIVQIFFVECSFWHFVQIRIHRLVIHIIRTPILRGGGMFPLIFLISNILVKHELIMARL